MVTRIHHVAIAVRSLETALRFYRDVLGMNVGRRASLADQGVEAALLPLTDGEIELVEPTNPTGGVARFLERKGEGLHHLCLETPDIAAALVEAKASDLPLIDQAPGQGLAGMIGFLHPKANHGLLVELAQPSTYRDHGGPPCGGVRAVSLGTVYLAVQDVAGAATGLARNFGGTVAPARYDSRLDAEQVVVTLGRSEVTLLGPRDLSRASIVSRFLVDRGEGLYAVGLGVRDFPAALRHLETEGIAASVHGAESAEPLASLDPEKTHGVNLFLCPCPPGRSPAR